MQMNLRELHVQYETTATMKNDIMLYVAAKPEPGPGLCWISLPDPAVFSPPHCVHGLAPMK